MRDCAASPSLVRPLLLAAVVSLLGGLLPAGACPYSIRDAGFIVRDPKPYQLAVLVKAGQTPGRAELEPIVGATARKLLADANVEAAVVDVDREGGHPAVKLLKETVPGRRSFPAHLLISPDGRALALKPGEGADLPARYEELMELVVTSPACAEIVSRLIKSWCVVLLVTGEDAEENARVERAVTEASRDIVGFKPEMGDKIGREPPLVRVAWDDPREQVLRWSLGLDERAPKRARVAVLFGTGRRCGPDLLAAEATRSKLMDLFRLLGRNCTCTTDPTWLLGPALPVDWSADLQAQVREALGFDPTSPAVAEALSGVWTKLRRPANGEAVPDSTTGYVEFSDERTSQPPPKEAGDDPDRRENSEGSFEQRGLRAAAVVGGGLLALAAGGTAILILRQSRRA